MTGLKTFMKDEKGNGILMFALSLVIFLSSVLLIETDYAKVLLSKASLSMVADIAASEAARELNMDLAANNGRTQLDYSRAGKTVADFIDKNKAFIPGSNCKTSLVIDGSGVGVTISTSLPLSGQKNAVITARATARVRSLN